MNDLETSNTRESLLRQLPKPYQEVFETWSDEDVKAYVYLINSSTPQDTFERTQRPDVLGLATAFHERAEMLIMSNLLSQKEGDDYHFAEKLRSGQLRPDQVHSYFVPEGSESPRKIYSLAHAQAYSLEMHMLQSLAESQGTQLSVAAIYATSPRWLNAYRDAIKDIQKYEVLYHKEKTTQMGRSAQENEFKDFPNLKELQQAYTFWKQFGNPYSAETEQALHSLFT